MALPLPPGMPGLTHGNALGEQAANVHVSKFHPSPFAPPRMHTAAVRCIIVPGNGGTTSLAQLRRCNFYGALEQLCRKAGHEAVLQPMPDPYAAKQSVWLPFIRDTLRADGDAVVIGHSSGAAAAMRLAEQHTLLGVVLVAAYDSDLGDEGEAASGYFDRPFDYAAMRRNCGFVVQFAGADDSLVPVGVQRRVAQGLRAAGGSASSSFEYVELEDEDHFFETRAVDLSNAVTRGITHARPAAR